MSGVNEWDFNLACGLCLWTGRSVCIISSGLCQIQLLRHEAEENLTWVMEEQQQVY